MLCLLRRTNQRSSIIVISSLNIVYAHDFLDRSDPTWVLVDEFLCDIIERNFTVVVANLPGLWMLFGQIRRRTGSSRGQATSYPYSKTRSRHGTDLLQSSVVPDRHQSPLSKPARKPFGGRKELWQRVGDADNFDQDFLLREVSAARSEPCIENLSGGIGVRTEIVISEESREEVELPRPAMIH